MTLATIIRDNYTRDTTVEIEAALKDLMGPDSYGWSPTGIYCFWDPEKREVLYLGLASNLATRFKKHNSTPKRHSQSDKSAQIADWFMVNKHWATASSCSQPLSVMCLP